MASVHTDLNYYTWKVSDKTYSSPAPMPRFVRRCRGDCRGDLLGDLSAKEWQHQLVIFYFFIHLLNVHVINNKVINHYSAVAYGLSI